MSTLANASSILASQLTDKVEGVTLLEGVNDDHGGVIIEMKDPMDPVVFTTSLRESIESWRKQGIKGVWINMPIKLANLIGPAVEEGFWYHHAEPDYLMLVYWIPKTAHTIPANATHRVRVGAFVVNEKREVLVVQEKIGKLGGSGVWKFPTGAVEQGEDIHIGAKREVKEETGIDTEFVEVLAFRHKRKISFDKSEVFFVCMLHPLSYSIHPQESEIEAAQWMPIEEYEAQSYVQNHDGVKHILDVCSRKLDSYYAGFSPVGVKSAFSDAQDYLYFNTRDLNQPFANGDTSRVN